MRKIIQQLNKPLSRYVLQPLYHWYGSSSRRAKLKGMDLVVSPGVFHPVFFFSTKILLNWLDRNEVKDRSLLEIGSGSGAVAIYAAKKKASVTAVDINPAACACTKSNAERNGQRLSVYQSDLLDMVPQMQFDIILINPPYFPKTPQNYAEQAWYCGEDFSFFERLFREISAYMQSYAKIILVLSEHCEIRQIREIAEKNQLIWNQIERHDRIIEQNYLFEINKYSFASSDG
ncbi:HemK2/MTQ2 family protein methyltransferase [Nubsella zeaxanthinifaciens]|uniref:HemK2/MTQ2 family protein methyltransferase n=1 Tax=Nubsella zeaxanthinifaciens TaxID=392412 RepID=UPI000DE3A271|nr:HemK2/MTQ2 family protein methyltransferase [Nubsella zeaxanthinifaciens]